MGTSGRLGLGGSETSATSVDVHLSAEVFELPTNSGPIVRQRACRQTIDHRARWATECSLAHTVLAGTQSAGPTNPGHRRTACRPRCDDAGPHGDLRAGLRRGLDRFDACRGGPEAIETLLLGPRACRALADSGSRSCANVTNNRVDRVDMRWKNEKSEVSA